MTHWRISVICCCSVCKQLRNRDFVYTCVSRLRFKPQTGCKVRVQRMYQLIRKRTNLTKKPIQTAFVQARQHFCSIHLLVFYWMCYFTSSPGSSDCLVVSRLLREDEAFAISKITISNPRFVDRFLAAIRCCPVHQKWPIESLRGFMLFQILGSWLPFSSVLQTFDAIRTQSSHNIHVARIYFKKYVGWGLPANASNKRPLRQKTVEKTSE